MIVFLTIAAFARPAHAWGDEGHEIIAIIARHYLTPAVAAKVDAMLSSDNANVLTAHDMALEATWADKLREADLDGSRRATREWHFTDIELGDGDQGAACFGHPALPTGIAAYPGIPHECAIDKVDQFRRELGDATIPPAERLAALKFLLHLVGDLHQPLHSADDHDRGGNSKHVTGAGRSRNLHAFWDTAVVIALGRNGNTVAADLLSRITAAQKSAWARGTPASWAAEAFLLAKADAYGRLPAPGADGSYELDGEYRKGAERDAALQLSRAGVRLAAVLNVALAAE